MSRGKSGMFRFAVLRACDGCGRSEHLGEDEILCVRCKPVSERQRIEKRLAEIEAMRASNNWKARTGTSMHGYKPLSGAIYAEMAALRDRLQELRT